MGSGCTMGKGNIQHRVQNQTCAVRFINHRTREKLCLKVQPGVWTQLHTPARTPVTSIARTIYRLPINTLFVINPESRKPVVSLIR